MTDSRELFSAEADRAPLIGVGPSDDQASPLLSLTVLPDLASSPADYEVVERVGSGGMGVVYKAKHKSLDKTVAVKFLHTELAADPVNVKRFQIEARAASSLTHANLAAVYEYGTTASGAPYLVMDYLEGSGLDQILKREGFLVQERFFSIFGQVCDALIHAHYKQIVHRDLKPSNIMILKQEDGSEFVKLVDFGIARVLQQSAKDGSRLTQTGEVIGSPVYMSPEQCLGLELDARSDIYSLGVVMYEALAGVPPFQGDNSIQIIVGHVNQKPRSIRKLRPDFNISPELEDLVMRTLEKDPAQRYQSVQELALDLELAQKSGNHRWSGWRRTLNKRSLARLLTGARKRRGFLLLGGIAGALTLLLAGFVTLGRHDLLTGSNKSVIDFQTLADKAELAKIRGDSKRVLDLYQAAVRTAEANKASDREIFDLCSQATNSLLGMINEPSRDRPVRTTGRREWLFSTGPFIEKALALTLKDADLKVHRGKLLQKLAEISHTKGDFKKEEQLLLESIDALNVAHEEFPHEEEKGQLLSESYVKLAQISLRETRYYQAIDRLKAAYQYGVDEPLFPAWKLAELFSAIGNYDESEGWFRLAQARLAGENNFYYLVQILPEWEAVLRSLNRGKEADGIEQWLKAIKQQDPGMTFVKQESALSFWGHLVPFPDNRYFLH
ncbi:MAG: hypothetical protein C5B53_09245 [Candidatus Melainabacteria bacterium]|nr:MAG: hypothetical protein C5B53_09245 [Candidatus Melainabacteria bacterium]